MNLLPFIAGAYAIGMVLPIGFAIQAALRLRTARRRLAALEPGRVVR
ncbi:MAG TPA: hypothetical protein VHY76_12450 [Acetobacteraceae bacterium]|jgi:hypothetical protein|nr:hypothetical protein [Acetobacteraceae bacterium]